jgi:hypothetical protein
MTGKRAVDNGHNHGGAVPRTPYRSTRP